MNVKNVYILTKLIVLKISVIVIRVSGDNGKIHGGIGMSEGLYPCSECKSDTPEDNLVKLIADSGTDSEICKAEVCPECYWIFESEIKNGTLIVEESE